MATDRRDAVDKTDATDTCTECDVLVVGCGAAGIGAALTLISKGKSVIVLEARGRVGGRCHTVDMRSSAEVDAGCAPIPVDMGGQWLHQCSDSNRLYLLARKLGVRFYRPDLPEPRSVWRWYDIAAARALLTATTAGTDTDHLDPVDVAPGELADAQRAFDGDVRTATKAGRHAKDDSKSVADWMRPLDGSQSDRWRRLYHTTGIVRAQVEGADWDSLSGSLWDSGGEMDGGDRTMVDGYGTFLASLVTRARVDVRLRHVVTGVTASKHRVTVETVSGDDVSTLFRARAVIVTVPVGVLRDGCIEFTPPLPVSKVAAAHAMGTAMMNKVALRFPSQFWDTSGQTAALIISDEDEDDDVGGSSGRDSGRSCGAGAGSSLGGGGRPLRRWPWIYNATYSAGVPVLLAFQNGSRAAATESMTDDEAVDSVMDTLRTVFSAKGVAVPDPVATRVSRWVSDPFSRGSWSCFAKGGAGVTDSYQLAQPAGERVLFAGEGTYAARAQGTVHGAFMSGEDAGYQAADLCHCEPP